MKYLESLKNALIKFKLFFKNAYWYSVMSFALGLGIGIFLATHTIVVYKHDNPMEEMVEKIIKDKLGVVLDLTPNSKECCDKKVTNSKRVRLPKK